MRGTTATLRKTLGRRELVPFLYRLGRSSASGMLTLSAKTGRGEVFVLRRGAIIGGKTAIDRIQRLAAAEEVSIIFEGGVAAAPPSNDLVPLAAWARQHLEAQLDGTLAEILVQELAGVRLVLKLEMIPVANDEADKRMIAALAVPRRLDQIWPLARTPRFRLLAFIHFLRTIDAVESSGVVAERAARGTTPPPPPPIEPPRTFRPFALNEVRAAEERRARAARLLGVRDDDDRDTVKRAYRRLARTIHPDLQPDADAFARRDLERRFAEITAAYQALV